MEFRQLEIDLWQSLEMASQFPETADLRELCKALEQILSERPLAEQLVVAGEVLVQLSEVCAARATLLMSGWERQHDPKEPVVALETCVDLFVQSLSLDVEDLFEEAEPVQYPANRKPRALSQADDSVVGEVNKDTLLSWVEQVAEEQALDELEIAEQIRELAHGENVEEWSRAIAAYLEQNRSKICLPDLQQALELPLVEVWLGLLLGGYHLEQGSQFYDPYTIWIVNTNT